MPKAFEEWTVLPHGSLQQHADNLWSIVGDLPGMPLKRRMTLAKLADGSVVVHNAMGLEPELMKRIEDWGRIAILIVPNGWHRLDAATFKKRYPDAKVFCPRGARKKVEEVVAVDGTYDEIPSDDRVHFEHLDGTKESEGVMRVHSADGDTLVFNDALFNVPHLPGGQGFILKLIGSTGGPKVTRIGRLFLAKDKPALRAHFERLATKDVVRILPGHGDAIDADAPGVLKAVAATL